MGSAKTFAQWQALGYDIHSVVVNPNFNNFTDFVPGRRLDYGTNLGSPGKRIIYVMQYGVQVLLQQLNQNGTWQVGAVFILHRQYL